MKKMKKIVALLLLAITFVFSGSVVYAEETTSKITIDNATVGETYKIYKLFDLESYNTTTGAYSYKKEGTAWDSFFGESGAGYSYINIDSQGYVTVKALSASNIETFAKAALSYATTNSITATATVTATTTTVVFSGLDEGYYLVDTTLGTLCSLDTTKDTDGITIKDKNTSPSVINKVEESSTYVKSADAKIGDELNFIDTITAFKGAQGYVLHVKLDSGLTYNTDVSIAKSDETALISGTDYTVSAASGDTFTITFTESFLNSITEETDIIVSYTANLNTSATIASTGNKSISTLNYDETGSKETSSSTAIVYTWKIDAKKYYMSNSVETGLANAKFKLSTTSTVANALSFVKSSNTYRQALSTESSSVTEITTDSTGEFSFTGLDSGTYYLIETEAPSGYNQLSSAVVVNIETTTEVDGTLSAKTKVNSTEVSTVKIENKSGTLLPSTGGMGTKIFIIVGSLIFIIAGIILVTKKRMYNMS